MNFTASLDPASLSEIARMYGFATLLEPEVQAALMIGAQKIAETAQENTWQVFENPTGTLSGSMFADYSSPYEVQVGVGVPYGRRREYGFIGFVDSLGRVGKDRARPYLQPAMEANEQEVLGLIEDAVDAAFSFLGGGSNG